MYMLLAFDVNHKDTDHTSGSELLCEIPFPSQSTGNTSVAHVHVHV